jgi:ubiquinone/menaquinone biosynthesis C-methylase UbiE
MLADASATGLQEDSVDMAFLFGVIYHFPRLDELLTEMYRVLKRNGKLSIESRRSEQLVASVTASGLFQFEKEDRGVNVFDKLVK